MNQSRREGQSPKEAALHCRLRQSQHAKKRQLQRGVTREEIREVIFRGRLRNRRGSWEAENRFLFVVFRLRPCNIFLITVHYKG